MTTADYLLLGKAPAQTVGLGFRNVEADVRVVQAHLVCAALETGREEYHPGPVDGVFGVGTGSAVEAFQRLHCWMTPDGWVSPHGATLRRLKALLAALNVEATFPFRRSSGWDYRTGMRRFGANRSGGRAHAGADLYFPEGTEVLAVADGVVTGGPYYFYNGTYAIEVDHGPFLARYGEVQRDTLARAGDRVERGQPIARVGHLQGLTLPSDMLHFELYDRTASGKLTQPTQTSARHPNGRTFRRRRDLLDPTPFLHRWPLP